MHRNFLTTAFAAAALFTPVSVHGTDYQLIATSGDSATGFGETVGSVDAPQINEAGEIAFSGNTSSSFVTAVWQWGAGVLRYVAVAEQPLSGLNSNPRTVGLISIDENGDVAFSAADQDSGRARYVELDGDLIKVVYEDDPAPLGGTWNQFAQDFSWRGGQVAFFGAVSTSNGTRRQLWLGPPSGLQVLAQEGSPSPLAAQDYGPGFDAPTLNRMGDLTFSFRTATSGGVAGGPADEIALFASEGQTGPETGNTLSTITPHDYTDDGVACLTANHRDMGGTRDGSAFYFADDNGLQIVTPHDWNPPGFDERFVATSDFFHDCASGGQVALIAAAFDRPFSERAKGIWAGKVGSLELVALEREQAPGLPPGVMFDDIADFVVTNAQGVVAFTASVDGPGINANNSRGLWAGSPGLLQLVAQTDSTIETDRGGRRVLEIQFSSGSLNGNNELAFASSGSVFVATLGPEVLNFIFGNGFE